VREKTDNMHGSVVLAPGDRFRADLGTTLWVSDGTTLWQYDKALFAGGYFRACGKRQCNASVKGGCRLLLEVSP